jgi:hypothetical protein
MVRFTYRCPFVEGISPLSYIFPFYDEQWLTYDPKDTTVCSLKSWADLFQHDEVVTLISDLIIIVIILFSFTFLENLLRFIRKETNCTEFTRLVSQGTPPGTEHVFPQEHQRRATCSDRLEDTRQRSPLLSLFEGFF